MNAAILLLMPLWCQSPVGTAGGRVDARCGSYCLFTALRAVGRGPTTFAELEQSLGKPVPEGYSMAELEDQAKTYGLNTMAVETTIAHLQARPRPFACIALLRPGHFVLLYDTDEAKAYVVDPPNSYTIPLPTFKQLWTRKALLIGMKPFQAEEELGRSWIAAWLPVGFGAAIVSVCLVLLIAWRKRGRDRVRSEGLTGLLVLLAGPLLLPGCLPAGDADSRSLEGAQVEPTWTMLA